MLRIIHEGGALPASIPVDPSAIFQAGNVLQLSVSGNQLVGTLSNGLAPLGIIDDTKTKAFTATAWDEEIIVAATGIVGPNSTLVTAVDIKAELANPNVVSSSFISNPVSVQLIPRNGVIVIPAGTELNFDLTGGGLPNAVRTVVRYQYQIPNVMGDDSTLATGRVTYWYARSIMETDIYDTTATYAVNANLFVNEIGQLTTKQYMPNLPSIGLVMSPPSPILGSLQFLWL